MIAHKKPVAAGSLVGRLARFVHLVEVVGGSENGGWIGKQAAQWGTIER